ncbi:MAG: undecaprenyl-diphosphatase UppP [Elusimicrobiota bacterium]
MPIYQSIIYGIIQGLTEFLPISSSAHLILLPWFTGWKDPGLSFDVALHWGTITAALIYYRKDIYGLIFNFLGFFQGGRYSQNILPLKIVVATIPGAVLGFLFEKQAETIFRSPALIAFDLAVLGTLLFLSDRKGSKKWDLSQLTWNQVLLIGVMQGCAIIPGISRSGITITTALFIGLNRSSAVKFSFLLSIPITIGAGLLKVGILAHSFSDPAIPMGIVVSALSGYLAIHTLVKMVQNKSFLPFVVYRYILAGAVAIKLLSS